MPAIKADAVCQTCPGVVDRGQVGSPPARSYRSAAQVPAPPPASGKTGRPPLIGYSLMRNRLHERMIRDPLAIPSPQDLFLLPFRPLKPESTHREVPR
ncbi:hypothetical protein EMIT0373P_20892 [Pseudomonas chlororaphis]